MNITLQEIVKLLKEQKQIQGRETKVKEKGQDITLVTSKEGYLFDRYTETVLNCYLLINNQGKMIFVPPPEEVFTINKTKIEREMKINTTGICKIMEVIKTITKRGKEKPRIEYFIEFTEFA